MRRSWHASLRKMSPRGSPREPSDFSQVNPSMMESANGRLMLTALTSKLLILGVQALPYEYSERL
jgi:hypothetical protein